MREEIKRKILDYVEEELAWTTELRRDLHQFPELGNEEYKTSDRVARELEDMHMDVTRPLRTAVMGVLKGTGRGGSDVNKVLAFRADMDALPIQEQLRLPFSSTRDGVLHACGHDAHTAILLGTAKVLSKMKDKLNGTVKFIFQPAEETTGGAERMMDAGCLKNPDVDMVLGLHVMPELPAGAIGVQNGRVHAASDLFLIRVKGMKSHGASPHCGVDAIVAASQIVNNLQAVISRTIDPLDSAVISIGSFHAGQAVNIVADEAVLEGTIRSFDETTREHLRCRLRETAELTAKAAGAYAEVHFQKGYDALINHGEGVSLVEGAVTEILGEENLKRLKEPSMGVDDFAYFLQRAKGAFFFLGSGFPHRENPPIHTDWFQINETCIRTGMAVETAAALEYLGE